MTKKCKTCGTRTAKYGDYCGYHKAGGIKQRTSKAEEKRSPLATPREKSTGSNSLEELQAMQDMVERFQALAPTSRAFILSLLQDGVE